MTKSATSTNPHSTHPSLAVATLGTPRIGPRRELKTALESFWAGKSDEKTLLEAASGLRAANWARQAARGVNVIPSNDFSLYDQVLDTSVMVGAIPARYGWTGGDVPLATYFAMARGSRPEAQEQACTHGHHGHDHGVPAQEMTKWFDTNYHYMVPEFRRGQTFALSSHKPIDEYREARALGYQTRPVLLGPVTYLRLGKSEDEKVDVLSLLPALLPVYVDVLRRLAAEGAEWVQLDEPCLVLDFDDAARAVLSDAYAAFAREVPQIKIMLTTYFGGLGDNAATVLSLPVAGLHLDLVRAPRQLDTVLARAPSQIVLSLGVIDGRNIWRSNLPALLDRLAPVVAARGAAGVQIAPSCSLLHVPIDLSLETSFDTDLKSWLAFAVQKMDELSVLGRALAGDRAGVSEAIAASGAAAAARRASPKVHSQAVADRVAAATAAMGGRTSAFAARAAVQRARFQLPAFPTTTIGSFPQTAEVRKARAAHDKGQLDDASYHKFLQDETARTIRWQEDIGLDVLVHGEFERNDMVQYFGEQLAGFAFTRYGWVQSYGSRCVRPPILFGDVSRPAPMTVAWWTFAQSLTTRPVKGMLTGPVTILNWSFVRDDVPRSAACRQIALAIRDEVVDLEKAGAAMIQIDEAALREGLPLRRDEWAAYLDWAVECFRIAASGVRDDTQIHTHMCYSEFNDIIGAIGAMDADVISIETSRSRMELLEAFRTYRYPNEIGPGVYDIHSPRVPDVSEMTELLTLARQRLADDQLWINPDCGLKTRRWEEVEPALVNMVAAAREVRALPR
ncbi:5-methyltetrahydropteroyltriglutamate--homocysteine S-methyltransferase [Bradyrhizobium sp. U87765 SZCCT0131]|uniref:5-methyltetrahydropteroyltriglutamate-- homocysteine S-methyltransferase n=1 Tax=unclassified Bradyrhizobium TaxID=2631580 RepID=UPI001BA55B1B|nr:MULTISPECIES: 5-methyltetrahydropteroyltriglutamate--homocysteine S-methyltransferase [unclassified Bradyrhizobium]MBR1221209.1 5-methyltetrahydropteroyltriglutamate--homocysteine S-methyltransferase [Bradyrhizobium sp. U87765 SZCCT0131]MBR1259970.1 5-methyltetrahydropteroyltriglutamate--homocysteine S-methyltransferase [Bradyrhizobium sp. U87765 SZCCT0134]MBR1307781.1 5-methyltetrahydropteroyltriglutamate--homocysteine S-methyltransferase [Bradyrhizobium sp. U87765 SZCCT0110]MBR1321735.1 5-